MNGNGKGAFQGREDRTQWYKELICNNRTGRIKLGGKAGQRRECKQGKNNTQASFEKKSYGTHGNMTIEAYIYVHTQRGRERENVLRLS